MKRKADFAERIAKKLVTKKKTGSTFCGGKLYEICLGKDSVVTGYFYQDAIETVQWWRQALASALRRALKETKT